MQIALINKPLEVEIMIFQRFIESTKPYERMTELSVFYLNYLASTEFDIE